MKYYNLDQISEILGVSYKTARRRIYRNNIPKVKTKNKRALYSENCIELIGNKEIAYYPIKTTIIYHIYESKMNYDNR